MKNIKKVFAVLFGFMFLGITPVAFAGNSIDFSQSLDPSKVKDAGGKLLHLLRMVAILALIAALIIGGVAIALNSDEMGAQYKMKQTLLHIALGIAVVALAAGIVLGIYKLLNPNDSWSMIRLILAV